MLNHGERGSAKCYHCCEREKSPELQQRYSQQQYNIADVFSGFKHLYDVAGTKLKSFVKGGSGGGGVAAPVKAAGGGTSASSSQ
jgi:hypothetical protein